MDDDISKGEIIPAGAKLGRPCAYTEAIANEICDRLSKGESLRSICRDPKMPEQKTVYRWLLRDDAIGETFRQQYARARELQADSYADEITDIADDGSNDWMEAHDKDGNLIGWRINGEHVQRSKLRIEARKWIASKLRPKKYGDATMIKHADADGQKIAPDMKDAAAAAAALLALAKERKEAKE